MHSQAIGAPLACESAVGQSRQDREPVQDQSVEKEGKIRRWVRWHEGTIAVLFFLGLIIIVIIWTGR
jgi:hypothetical protein